MIICLCRALFSFSPDSPKELRLQAGQLVRSFIKLPSYISIWVLLHCAILFTFVWSNCIAKISERQVRVTGRVDNNWSRGEVSSISTWSICNNTYCPFSSKTCFLQNRFLAAFDPKPSSFQVNGRKGIFPSSYIALMPECEGGKVVSLLPVYCHIVNAQTYRLSMLLPKLISGVGPAQLQVVSFGWAECREGRGEENIFNADTASPVCTVCTVCVNIEYREKISQFVVKEMFWRLPWTLVWSAGGGARQISGFQLGRGESVDTFNGWIWMRIRCSGSSLIGVLHSNHSNHSTQQSIQSIQSIHSILSIHSIHSLPRWNWAKDEASCQCLICSSRRRGEKKWEVEEKCFVKIICTLS